jgi:hypothetical protein
VIGEDVNAATLRRRNIRANTFVIVITNSAIYYDAEVIKDESDELGNSDVQMASLSEQ